MRSIILSAFLLSFDAISGINFYDKMIAGQLHPTCGKALREASIPRSLFVVEEIKKRLKPLRALDLGQNFYHYTNNETVASYFSPQETDRSRAQQTLESQNSMDEIMEFSFKDLRNLAGPGFYLAGNPVSSRQYGKFQIHFEIHPEAQVLVDLRSGFNDFAPFLSQVTSFFYDRLDGKQKNILRFNCNSHHLLGVALQESGVDLVFYDKSHAWFALYNTDVIESTDIMNVYNDSTNLIKLFAENDRLDELNPHERIGLQNVQSFHYLNSLTANRILDWLLSHEAFTDLSSMIRRTDLSIPNPKYPEMAQDIPDLILSLSDEAKKVVSKELCLNDFEKKKKIVSLMTKAIAKDKVRAKALKKFEKDHCPKD